MNRSYVSLRKVSSFTPDLQPSFGGVGGPASMQRGTGSALVLSKDEMLSKEALVMTAGHVGVGIAIGVFAAKAVGVTMLGGVGIVMALAGAGATYYFKSKEEE